MQSDLINIVNEKNELTGAQETWGNVHKKALIHRSVHIWIYNENGEVLLQLRSKEKFTFPDLWDISCAGHVDLNEDPKASALRELEEELGLKINPVELVFKEIIKEEKAYNGLSENEFCYIYLLNYNGKAQELILQKEEVQDAKFFNIANLKKDLTINADKFVPHTYWINILEEIEKMQK